MSLSFQPIASKTSSKSIFLVLAIAFVSSSLTGCGTLTGIPAHGGGKRFATEQRLVSASIRAALKDVDVTSLKGKRAALVFDIVADEGGGNMSGGRINPGLLFSMGSMMSPVTSTSSAFQIFNMTEGGSNYSNTGGGSSSNATTTTVTNGTGSNSGSSSGTNTGSGTSTGTNTGTSTGSGTNTSNGTSSGTNTNTGTSSGTNTNTGTNNSSGTNTATTGGTTTTGGFDQTGGNTGSGTNTGTSTGSGTNTGTNSNTGSNTSTGTTAGTNTGSNTSSGTNTGTNSGSNSNNSTVTSTQGGGGNNSSSTGGGYNTSRQTLSPSATSTTSQTEGKYSDRSMSLAYKGLGEYQNMAVPKSDATLLMGLVRNYLLFSGITPTVPTDPKADVLIYVTVDVFGTVRSRFDALAYNNETVKAETSFEISAFDKEGKMILKPTVANREAQYREHYLMWAGPFITTEKVNQGTGLLVDFTDVDGTKANYNPKEPVSAFYPLRKN
jgi:hypothetical protein